MAEASDCLERLLSCSVCFNQYGEGNNEFTPRLLPCSHTVCEQCIKQLIEEQKLECPECRTKHEASNAEKSFPQNKYLLTQTKKKDHVTKVVEHEYRRCEEHKKDLILFCREADCRKAICTKCLKTSHKKHDVTEIEDEEKENIIETITLLMSGLQNKMQKISSAKDIIENEADACIHELIKEKEEICAKFDKTIDESKTKVEVMRTLAEDELYAMNETMTVLSDMKKAVENMNVEENAHAEIMSKLDTINCIEENISKHLSGTREYVFNSYISRQDIRRMVEEDCVTVELNEYSSCDDSDDNFGDAACEGELFEI